MGIVARIHTHTAKKEGGLRHLLEFRFPAMGLHRGHVGFTANLFQRILTPDNVSLQAFDQLRFRQPLRLLRGYAAKWVLVNAQGLAGQEPLAGGVDMGMNADPPQVGDAGYIAGGDDPLLIVPALALIPSQHVHPPPAVPPPTPSGCSPERRRSA